MGKRRVLVVDDDVNLSRLTGMILEKSGEYEVMIVNQSARALAAAVQFQAEVMLLDVDMPGLSGGDLASAAALDSRLRDVPVLFHRPRASRGDDKRSSRKRRNAISCQTGGFRPAARGRGHTSSQSPGDLNLIFVKAIRP